MRSPEHHICLLRVRTSTQGTRVKVMRSFKNYRSNTVCLYQAILYLHSYLCFYFILFLFCICTAIYSHSLSGSTILTPMVTRRHTDRHSFWSVIVLAQPAEVKARRKTSDHLEQNLCVTHSIYNVQNKVLLALLPRNMLTQNSLPQDSKNYTQRGSCGF